ncbi:hypothetical protein ACS0TY_014232 [Phlomoides rotata]
MLGFDLPEELLQVLPSDPFEQLDVARKITSIALSARVDSLESEISELRHELADRDNVIAGLESQLQSVDASLNEASDKLAAAQQEKDDLMTENAQLSSTVKKLNRDVTRLEAFRKTLMRSLQEDEDNPATAAKVAAQNLPSNNEDVAALPPRTASTQSQFSGTGNSNSGDTETEAVRPPRIPHGLLLASQTSTPRLTPPGSPPSLSASVSPSRTPKPVSPRRHSVSFSSARGFFDDRSSFSSAPSSQFSSMSSLDSGSQPGKTRVDGKEFFRQVRYMMLLRKFQNCRQSCIRIARLMIKVY